MAARLLSSWIHRRLFDGRYHQRVTEAKMTDAEDLLFEIANSMNKDFLDPAEHANWAVQVAQEYFKSKGERRQDAEMIHWEEGEDKRGFATWLRYVECGHWGLFLTAELPRWSYVHHQFNAPLS